ncbi:DUF221-domain-containing protein [Myriangium duriaei CBS 260.36]|uniref:DUF221-domain-containing protein n=1 Tax=Myriangium duriaei CBS 260.36 TaxID=1168546 RepID=A0A9P4J1P6_9PEZI|nr:DUF221-domain-containing protein [Myriangium duriaei CBS 260.36]
MNVAIRASNSTNSNPLDSGAGAALRSDGQSAGTLLAAIASAFISFGAQFLAFYLLRWRLSRIYRPKTFMVAERQRVPIPASGPYQWALPLFSMPNSTIINKCGLDAYFFLRYLRMLLKIFVPMAVAILPILLPINRYSGPGITTDGNGTVTGVTQGVNVLGWQNINGKHQQRTWAHLILAVLVILWVCYVIYQELRGYIRIRQAYLTSPQHRIRASATTVLVSGIPRKWLSVEALSGLYDVFPGGIRNIWINRDFDELLEKVKLRNKIAKNLESAETNLIKLCVKKHRQAEEKKAKEQGTQLSKQQKKDFQARENEQAKHVSEGQGMSSGDPHQMAQNIHDAADDYRDGSVAESEQDREKQGITTTNPLKLVGHGIGVIGNGLSALGQKGKNVVGEVAGEINNGVTKTSAAIDSANMGGGLHRFSDERTQGSIDRLQPREPEQDEGQPREDQHENENGTKGFLSRTATKVKARRKGPPIAFPSPQPQLADAGEYPLNDLGKNQDSYSQKPEPRVASSKWVEALRATMIWKKSGDEDIKPDYPSALNEDFTHDQDGEAEWMKYIEAKDRDTSRLPLASWLPSLPLMGKKVDTIYHLRKELARLNAEIEYDQNDVERFPFMNSAFIQFNHQVAAHMACQAVSHHIPQHMAPRSVEISPNDVIWANMSIKWWERYVRTGLVVAASIGLIILFAIPVSFTGALSSIDTIKYSWLDWLHRLPKTAISIIQGILPPVLLSILLALVPIIFRALVKLQGVSTLNDRELGVQQYYFIFLFVQVFLVATISTGISRLVSQAYTSPLQVIQNLSQDVPKASNYFFSYMIVQALGNSSGALLQVGTLLFWFILGPILDTTARQKWQRQVELQNVQWGSYFPPFTNFAVIGMIFSIISPLILVFNLITFSLFWFVQRYNVIYVYLFRSDTGGLLFPKAVDQLFAGLYVMEITMAGLFFIARDANGKVSSVPQGIIMVIALASTIIYQLLLNSAFKPLLRYLPITLEDEAVIRDEEFARAQASKFRGLTQEEPDERESEEIEDRLEQKERREEAEERAAKQAEKDHIRERRSSRGASRSTSRGNRLSVQTKPKDGSWKHSAWKSAAGAAKQRQEELENQRVAGDVLFSGFSDELEDLTPEERDTLVRYSFQHEALRARRPVVWIPRDPLGISDDEIARSKLLSTVETDGDEKDESMKTYIWMSNEGTALDAKGRVVFGRSPPDFASVDLIEL